MSVPLDEFERQFQYRALVKVTKGDLIKKFMNRHPEKKPHRRTIRADPNKMLVVGANTFLYSSVRPGMSATIARAARDGTAHAGTEIGDPRCFTVKCLGKGDVCLRAKSPEEAELWVEGLELHLAGVTPGSLYPEGSPKPKLEDEGRRPRSASARGGRAHRRRHPEAGAVPASYAHYARGGDMNGGGGVVHEGLAGGGGGPGPGAVALVSAAVGGVGDGQASEPRPLTEGTAWRPA